MARSSAHALVLVVAAIAFSPDASAFCRTASCKDGTGAQCTPAQPDDCGIPVFWASPCVGFSLQKDASSEVSLSAATDVFTQAFAAWTSADCGGGATPRLRVDDLGTVECDQHEFNQQEEIGNANIILFRDDSWPHGGNSTLALTTVTYNLDTGEIYDADMELNSAQADFTTGDSNVKFDLRSIATHETGHFLGLSHSAQKDATMFKDYVPGSVALRTLTDDDRAAICDAYPPGDAIPSSCDPAPRHGLASECSSPPDSEGCCSTAPGAPTRSGEGLLAALFGAAVLAARRRGRS